MSKIITDNERRLQKKLIPLNIFVCILCLVAAVSLFYCSLVKVDVGKILRSNRTMSVVEDKIDEMVGGNTAETADFDYVPVVTAVVRSVLGSAKGTVSISAYSACRFLFAEGDGAEAFSEQFLFGDAGLVVSLVDSIVNYLKNILSDDGYKEQFEGYIVSALTSVVTSKLPEEVAEKLTDAHIDELSVILKDIDSIQNRTEAENVADKFLDRLENILGEQTVSADKQEIKDNIMKLYDETVDELKSGEEFSLEALICVAASKNLNLQDFDFSDALENMFGSSSSGKTEGSVKAVTADYALSENSARESGNVVCTTYSELLASMGLGEEDIDGLAQTLKEKLQNEVETALSDYSEYFGYYGYVFYAMLAFIVPWLILFLFSFFRMFAKNKRFMMWYVKLTGFIPALISICVIAAKSGLLLSLFPSLFEGEYGGLLTVLINGLSSFTWISGICYIVLWLVSIFWAFPIKHKIRKERKLVKQGLAPASTDYNAYLAGGYAADTQPYGDYSADYGFDDDYDDGFDDYGGYGSDGFDDDYDDDYDYGGYGSYGGFNYDDDDDDLF